MTPTPLPRNLTVNTADLKPAEYTPVNQAEEDAKWAAIRAAEAAEAAGEAAGEVAEAGAGQSAS